MTTSTLLQISDAELRVNPDKLRNMEFLFPDNTANFYKLPLEFKVTIVSER
jgi:hypothetical protein